MSEPQQPPPLPAELGAPKPGYVWTWHPTLGFAQERVITGGGIDVNTLQRRRIDMREEDNE